MKRSELKAIIKEVIEESKISKKEIVEESVLFEEGWLSNLSYGIGKLMEKATNPVDLVKNISIGFSNSYKKLAAKLKDAKTKQEYFNKQFDKDLTDLIKIANDLKNKQIDGEKLAATDLDVPSLVATISQTVEYMNLFLSKVNEIEKQKDTPDQQ